MSDPKTRTVTFAAKTMDEIRERLETRFSTGIVVEQKPWGYEWAAKQALAWGRIVREGYEYHHDFIVDVTAVIE